MRFYCRLLLPKINKNKSERKKSLIKNYREVNFRKNQNIWFLSKKSDLNQKNRFFRFFLEKIDFLPTLVVSEVSDPTWKMIPIVSHLFQSAKIHLNIDKLKYIYIHSLKETKLLTILSFGPINIMYIQQIN